MADSKMMKVEGKASRQVGMFPEDDDDTRSLGSALTDDGLPFDFTGCEDLRCATCNVNPLSECILIPAAFGVGQLKK